MHARACGQEVSRGRAGAFETSACVEPKPDGNTAVLCVTYHVELAGRQGHRGLPRGCLVPHGPMA